MLRGLLVWALFFVGTHAALFTKTSGVREVKAAKFTDEVLYSPLVTAVMFYSPHCGYCKSMAPEWQSAAQAMRGIAKFVAVDCTLDTNQHLCSKHGVKGYPSIQVFQPAKLDNADFERVNKGADLPRKKPQRYNYNSQREKDAFVSFIKSKILNYAVTLTSESAEQKIGNNSNANQLVFLQGAKSSAVLPISTKVLSREYFGKVEFFVLPRKTKSVWEKLGFKPIKKDQVVFIDAKGKHAVYTGEPGSKMELKKFIKTQLESQQTKQDL